MSGKYNVKVERKTTPSLHTVEWGKKRVRGRYNAYKHEITVIVQERVFLLSPKAMEIMGEPPYMFAGLDENYLIFLPGSENDQDKAFKIQHRKRQNWGVLNCKSFISDNALSDPAGEWFLVYRGHYDRHGGFCFFDLTQRASKLKRPKARSDKRE